MKNKIILTSGDPNSVNSEIIYKTWRKLNKSLKKYLLYQRITLSHQFKRLKYSTKIVSVKDLNQKITHSGLKVLNVDISFKKSLR